MKKEEERQRQTSGLCKVKKDIQGESKTRMNSRMERNETENIKYKEANNKSGGETDEGELKIETRG